jgi:hypothetical protein
LKETTQAKKKARARGRRQQKSLSFSFAREECRQTTISHSTAILSLSHHSITVTIFDWEDKCHSVIYNVT